MKKETTIDIFENKPENQQNLCVFSVFLIALGITVTKLIKTKQNYLSDSSWSCFKYNCFESSENYAL